MREKANLSVSVFGSGGSVSWSPAGTLHEYDTNVTLTATADPHFEFVRWNGDGVSQPTSAISTLAMTARSPISISPPTALLLGRGFGFGAGVHRRHCTRKVPLMIVDNVEFRARESFDVAQVRGFCVIAKGDGYTGFTGPACAANTVDIGF